MTNKDNGCERTVLICQGTGCVSGGAVKIREALEKGIAELGLTGVKVDFTGCHGFCEQGPIAIIEPDGIFYTHVTLSDIPEIIQSHLVEGYPVERLFYKDPVTCEIMPYYSDINFFDKQQRVLLKNCGHINPEKIEDYIAVDGYKSLQSVLSSMTPEKVIDEVKHAGLRGMGGGGFLTALKWELCRKEPGIEKYIICNADEGDPGAFMDRTILESNPHSVIEGMIIAAYAVGASNGYIYVRTEYLLAVKRIRLAVEMAHENGFLGDNILGSDFCFNIHIKEGAGSYICGEETALIASIEGKRGIPRSRPPYPSQSGLWGRPTCINNVKTLATVPVILYKGAEWYSGLGVKGNQGTVVLSLTGSIANRGLVEVPMGTSVKELIYDIGGGILNKKRFKAVQIGGVSEGCLPSTLLNTPIDYNSLLKMGNVIGSGTIIVMDEDTCMVDMARYLLAFSQAESCGKCAPCRLGTKKMLDILENICNGQGKIEDIDMLLELAKSIKAASLCGLGQSAPNTVLSTLRYFREEYEEHILKHHCRAAVCKGLVKAPCSHTCPAGIDVPRYVRFIEQGKPEEALAVIREKIPFPSVCGMVCFHPCETKCRRAQLDEAVAIRELKRYASEHGGDLWKQRSVKSLPTGKRVAIIGAGPAGLTAAYYLAKLGHSITVFESEVKAGGMLRLAIPEYRLPKRILDLEIEEIVNAGVSIKTNTEINSVGGLFEDGYEAVFVAIGAQNDIKMGIEGEEDSRFIDRLAFLKNVNTGKKVSLGNAVAVIGGGHAAIDVARTAKRLGVKDVVIIYRRTREDMPAGLEEVEEAVAEGIKICELAMPAKVINEDGGIMLECIRMAPGDIDTSGRRRSVPIEGSEFIMRLDNVIASIGQRLRISDRFDLPTGDGEFIQVNNLTLSTSKKGVFAGGDAVLGPSSVIEAIAHGRQAAKSIDIYLGGSGNIDEVLASSKDDINSAFEPLDCPRHKSPVLPVEKRLDGFATVELGYDKEMAEKEAGRCLRCDLKQ